MRDVKVFALAGCVLVIVAVAAIGAPTVTMTLTRSVIRTNGQGAGTYNLLDFFYSNSPGAEFVNYILDVQTTAGNLNDSARLQDDRQISPFAAGQDGGTAGSVDTWANTVWSSAGKVDLGLTSTIVPDPGSYAPTGSGAAPPFTHLNWNVFDNVTGDDNDLSNDVANPTAVAAPYHIARVQTSINAIGTVEFRAFDTLSNGQPTTFLFSFSPDSTPPSVVDHVVGPPYIPSEPGQPQTLTHQFQASEPGSSAGPFTWDMLSLQSYTPNYGAQYDDPVPTGPITAPTLTSGGLFSWVSEGSAKGDYVWQVRATNLLGVSDFGTITVHANPIALIGDYNLDTIVDAADYVWWRKQVGYAVPRCSGGDSNCNGFVEFVDYEPWAQSYGHTLTGGAASSNGNVPESSWMALMAVAFLAASGNRFRSD